MSKLAAIFPCPDFKTMGNDELLRWYVERVDWDLPSVSRLVARAKAEIIRRMKGPAA